MFRFLQIPQIKKFNTNVWYLLTFSYLNRLGFFMSIPYLAFYLFALHYSPVQIGFIVSSQALSYSLFSIFCGYLSDRFGKKHAMITAMLISTIASLGLAHVNAAFGYILFNSMIGLSRSFFDASMPAYLTDITTPESHRLVFNLRFLIVNLAGATGPIIGVYFARHHLHSIFDLSALSYFISACLILWKLPNDYWTKPVRKDAIQLSTTIKSIINDKVLLYVVIGTIIYWFIYIQLEAPLAQILQDRNPETATSLFLLMWIINTVMIVILQLPIAGWTKNTPLKKMIYFGGVFFVLGFVGLALFLSSIAFAVCIAFITLGEILYSPICNIIIADIAPSEMRSAYFGAISLCSIGTAIGPVVGGLLIQYGSNETLFLTMALLTLLIMFCYRRSFKTIGKSEKHLKNNSTLMDE